MVGSDTPSRDHTPMPAYSDFANRLLLQDYLLTKLIPTDTYSTEWVLRIREADPATLLGSDTPLSDAARPELIRAALFYAVDSIHEAHTIFQDEKTDLGSYWHGMMHRREGDFDNARYWFRRAGSLPFFRTLHRNASAVSADLARQLDWDPYLFTGLCEQARFGAEETIPELVRLQRLEFDAIFDYTWRQTTSTPPA